VGLRPARLAGRCIDRLRHRHADGQRDGSLGRRGLAELVERTLLNWDGRRAIRISVSNWQTEYEEINLALESFRRAVQAPAQAPAR